MRYIAGTDGKHQGTCELYKHRQPSLVTEWHHVVPESWFHRAGQMVDTPMMSLCPTCHMNVHWWIDTIVITHKLNAPATSFAQFPLPPLKPFRAYELAMKGYELGVAAGLVPRRTL